MCGVFLEVTNDRSMPLASGTDELGALTAESNCQ
jgi:hypothetical protein